MSNHLKGFSWEYLCYVRESSEDLNNRLVKDSNDKILSDCWMVCYLENDQNSGLKCLVEWSD